MTQSLGQELEAVELIPNIPNSGSKYVTGKRSS